MNKMLNHKNATQAFTLLEVMIAMSIFGFLMVYVAQFTRSEIQIFESVSRQNNVEQKARSSMMHILDEIRLNQFVFFEPDPAKKGIYRNNDASTTTSTCLIDITPRSDLVNPLSAEVFLANNQLWYRSPSLPGNPQFLIADEIMTLSITPDPSDPHLIEIYINSGDSSKKSQPFKLRTWIRLY